MDVPFVSSGAMSRAHYALVRKVETATSPQAADTMLLTEIEAIHYRLMHSTLTQNQVRECLISLLYCSTAMAPGTVPDVSFALPHAISLAEAGKTVQDKRIGYEFCAEIMPRRHELELMLVNTLRKDLHSDHIPRICLALDALIQIPPEDVVPAVQDRLFDLISHTSPLVRQRTLFAYRSLAQHSRGILKQIVDKVRKRLEGHDHAVAGAALATSVKLYTYGFLSDATYHAALSRLLRDVWQDMSRTGRECWLLLKVLQALRDYRSLSREDLDLILNIVRAKRKRFPLENAIIYQCFLVLAAHPDLSISDTASLGSTFIGSIRDLLTSEDMNDIYTFISCLECIDSKYWAGTSPAVPSVLEAWEVERVMNLLGCNDHTIRKKVLGILSKVDRSIVETYFTQLSASNYAAAPREGSGELKRPLEVIEILSGDDGEAYAQQVVHMLTVVAKNPQQRKGDVYENAVEDILNHIRNSSVELRSGALGVLFALLANRERSFDATLVTILCALICEFLDSCPVSPEDILRGLAAILPCQSGAIQDACLLAMMRVSATCQTMPEEILGVVRKVQETGGRHIKRRSTQFLELFQSPQTLKDIVSRTRSNSLPDFLVALETYEAEKRATGSISRVSSSGGVASSTSSERPSSRASSMTASKLRYAAYEAPRPTPSLRRRASNSSSLSAQSDPGRASEELSRTFTPGELALAAGRPDLQEIARSPVSSPPTLPTVEVSEVDELANQADLITLESPFVSEPTTSISSLIEPDFESLWNSSTSFNARGWYDAPIDAVVRKLLSLQKPMRVTAADEAPFAGDLKIIITPASTHSDRRNSALLRLREGEEDSCLWHLRCADVQLLDTIKALLKDT